MAEQKKQAQVVYVDPWETPVESWEYVTIPEENALGYPHDKIGINEKSFGPGTHHVPAKVAETIRDRVTVYNKAVIRTLQPNREQDAQKIAGIGSYRPANPQPADGR